MSQRNVIIRKKRKAEQKKMASTMKRLASVVFIGVLISCGDPNGPAPKKQDDACSILKQRPGWIKDMRRAERKWGVPVSVQMAIIWKESSFRPKARPRKEPKGSSSPGEVRSSAYGYPQALDGTWDWYRESTGNRRARRDDYGDASDFVGWYANESLKRNGISKTDAYNLYLTYHQGHGGFERGSHLSKDWLLQVARQVRTREELYRNQLPYCLY